MASTPQRVTLAGDNSVKVHIVDCSSNHVIALTHADEQLVQRLFTWGAGEFGCLATGDEADQCAPVEVHLPMYHRVQSVYAANGATVVLCANGHVYACGANRHNRLGFNWKVKREARSTNALTAFAGCSRN